MTVSVAIVAYNEEETLQSLLSDIEKQTYPKKDMEIVLVDSCSTDSTKNIMESFAKTAKGYMGIQVLDNPNKKQATGWNVAIENYKGDAIVRIDGHACVPSDFIEKKAILLEAGEAVSGGKCASIIDGETPWKKTLLMAETSMFGSSIASYRSSNEKRYVDSICHGMYKREVFEKAGLFNEHLGRTEDNEIHYRIRKAGFKLCYDPEIISYQHARSSLKKMLRQKYLNGYWVGLTLGVCPGCLSLFHFVPLAFVLAIITCGIIACFGFFLPMIILWSCYGAANLLMTALSIAHEGFKLIYCTLPLLFLLLHVSYGIGTLFGILSIPFKISYLRGEK